VDRLVQQMILQVLDPILDPTFPTRVTASGLDAAHIWRSNRPGNT